MSNPIVHKIPAMPQIQRRLRTAAYCRVSTDEPEQLGSLEYQREYYENFIKSNFVYDYAGVFWDKASGCKANRPGLQELLELCRDGKVDLILTKSLKRFSRNIVDALTILRELKELGIDVFFEIEDLHLNDPNFESVATIQIIFAQEESRNISGNVSWGVEKSFRNGSSKHVNKKCYGYTNNKDGKLIPHKKEAVVVREMFKARAEGVSIYRIAANLNSRGILSPTGKKWSTETISKILQNDKYIGDVTLQKTYVRDYLTGKQHKNNGERAKYHIKGSHEGIISEELFSSVQTNTIQ